MSAFMQGALVPFGIYQELSWECACQIWSLNLKYLQGQVEVFVTEMTNRQMGFTVAVVLQNLEDENRTYGSCWYSRCGIMQTTSNRNLISVVVRPLWLQYIQLLQQYFITSSTRKKKACCMRWWGSWAMTFTWVALLTQQ